MYINSFIEAPFYESETQFVAEPAITETKPVKIRRFLKGDRKIGMRCSKQHGSDVAYFSIFVTVQDMIGSNFVGRCLSLADIPRLRMYVKLIW